MAAQGAYPPRPRRPLAVLRSVAGAGDAEQRPPLLLRSARTDGVGARHDRALVAAPCALRELRRGRPRPARRPALQDPAGPLAARTRSAGGPVDPGHAARAWLQRALLLRERNLRTLPHHLARRSGAAPRHGAAARGNVRADHDLRIARQVASVGAGPVSTARPPEGAPVTAARPPEGAHAAGEGEGVPAGTAQRPIRLGVAGLGRAFTLMLPTLVQDSRVQLRAACDPRAAARAQFLRDFGAPAYPDIEGLAADPSVDAIYIASPHALHARHTCIAARHGKHVLVEKPMALTLAECDAMIAACRAAGVQLIVGHCHSFDAPYAKARAIIAGGGVGPVRMIHALNYTDFLYRPRRPEELQTEAGGGVVFSQAAHQIDIVRL